MEELNKKHYVLKENAQMLDFTCETNFDFQQNNDKNEVLTFNLYKSSKPVFINFWATWCGPCVGEMPDLQRLFNKYYKTIDFIFINCGANKKGLTDFLKNNKYKIPIGFDENNELSNLFGVKAIPMTIIIDKNKIIKNIIIGARNEKQYEGFISDLLKN